MAVNILRQILVRSHVYNTLIVSVTRHDAHPDKFIGDSGSRASNGRMIHERWTENYKERNDVGLIRVLSRHIHRETEAAYIVAWWRGGPNSWEVQREHEVRFWRRHVQQGLASGQSHRRGANSMSVFLFWVFHVQCNLPPSSQPYHQQIVTVPTAYIGLKAPGTNDWVRNNGW